MNDTSNGKVESLDIDSILENYTKAANDPEIGEQSMDSIVKWIENYEFKLENGDITESQYSSFAQQLEARISKLDCCNLG